MVTRREPMTAAVAAAISVARSTLPSTTRSRMAPSGSSNRRISRVRAPCWTRSESVISASARSAESRASVGRISPLANPESDRRSTPSARATSCRVNPDRAVIRCRSATTSSAADREGPLDGSLHAVIAPKACGLHPGIRPIWSAVPTHETPHNGGTTTKTVRSASNTDGREVVVEVTSRLRTSTRSHPLSPSGSSGRSDRRTAGPDRARPPRRSCARRGMRPGRAPRILSPAVR